MKYIIGFAILFVGGMMTYLVKHNFAARRGSSSSQIVKPVKRNATKPTVGRSALLSKALKIADNQPIPLSKEEQKEREKSFRRSLRTIRLGNPGPDFTPHPAWQATQRLASIREAGYSYREAHVGFWKALLFNQKASVYGRLCAAFYLLETSPAARSFVALQLGSVNLRHRYNAARLLYVYAKKGPTQEWYNWAMKLLIGAVDKGALNGSGVNKPPKGAFSQGDRDDIIYNSLDDILNLFVAHKTKAAVAPLLKQIGTRKLSLPVFNDIARALGALGDRRAIPTLVRLAKKYSGPKSVFFALGALRAKEATPALLVILKGIGRKKDSGFGELLMRGRALLEAMALIKDPASISGMQRFLRHNKNKKLTPVVKRVLAQLTNKDPVDALWRLYKDKRMKDFYERRQLLYTLARYPSAKAIAKLNAEAKTSRYIYLRVAAAYALGNTKTKQGFLALAALLRVVVPKDIDKTFCWRCMGDMTKLLHKRVVKVLRDATKQSFGQKPDAWRQWIEKHIP